MQKAVAVTLYFNSITNHLPRSCGKFSVPGLQRQVGSRDPELTVQLGRTESAWHVKGLGQPRENRSEKCPGAFPAAGEARAQATGRSELTGLGCSDRASVVELGAEDTALLMGKGPSWPLEDWRTKFWLTVPKRRSQIRNPARIWGQTHPSLPAEHLGPKATSPGGTLLLVTPTPHTLKPHSDTTPKPPSSYHTCDSPSEPLSDYPRLWWVLSNSLPPTSDRAVWGGDRAYLHVVLEGSTTGSSSPTPALRLSPPEAPGQAWCVASKAGRRAVSPP